MTVGTLLLHPLLFPGHRYPAGPSRPLSPSRHSPLALNRALPLYFHTAGADSFGYSLKDDIPSHIHSFIPNVKIVNLGVDKYYTIASLVGRHVSTSRSSSAITTHVLLFCGIGIGVSIFANKHPFVYTALSSTEPDGSHKTPS